MFFLGVALLGIITFTQIGVDFLPTIKIPELLVETDLSGAPAEGIEKSVTRPVEEVVSTVDGVKSVTSLSEDGRSLVTISFYWGTDIDYAMLEVREKLDEVRGLLPRDAGRPTIFRIDPSTESIMTLAVTYPQGKNEDSFVRTSEEMSDQGMIRLAQLKEFAELVVKRRLEQIAGVAQAAVAGGVQREIRVDVDLQKLSSLGLTIEDVAQALKNANVNLEGGTINQGVFRYSLRTIGEFQSLQNISDVVVRRSGDNSSTQQAGSVTAGFPLSTFATVNESFAKREGLTRLDGKEAILIFIKKEANANTLAVSKHVGQVVTQLNEDFPNVNIATIFNQADFIGKSISDIEQAIIFGAFLALLVLFVFLRDPRYPLLIAAVTPLSILATIILMYFSGITFNIISLTGLSLGIGMIGDNAIIVVENFSRLREKGYSVTDAVIEGSKEINLSVAASTFTNVVIFLPVIFVRGLAQKLFLDMGLTMTFSLLASLLIAVTIVPSFLARMKHDREVQPVSSNMKSTGLLPTAYARFMAWYLKFLKFSLGRPGIVIGGTAILTLLSLGTAFLIRTEEAPDIDQSRFVMLVNLPPYASLTATDFAVRQVESVLLKMPEIKAVVSDVGIYSTEDYFEVLNSSVNSAKIECSVKGKYSVKNVIDEVRNSLVHIQPQLSEIGASIMITRPSTTFERILEPRKSDIDIEIIGDNLSGSIAVADTILSKLKSVNYLTDVGLEGEPTAREIWLLVNKTAARSYGMDMTSLTKQISDLVHGVTATYFDRFDEKYAIRVVPGDSSYDRNVLKTVLDYNVGAPSGVVVPVRDLVRVEERNGYSSITHKDQQRAVVIHANVTTSGILGAVNNLKELTSKIALPRETQIKIGGKIDDIRTTFKGLVIIILLAIFLVFVILASEYESILYPFVILTASPLAVVGAFIFMFIFGQTYNLMSIIGIVIMLGAVDNDAVIAVDMMISNRRNGMPLNEAIIEGMRKRFRPIVMTTLTSILGMVPLVLGIGKGLELAEALSYPIIGGLIGSTLFTLFLIPVLYKYFDRLSRTVRKVE